MTDGLDHRQGGSTAGVVWDLGNVLIDWDPLVAVAAAVGDAEAHRFLEAVDFRAWNHGPDSGGSWDDAEAEMAAARPHFRDHALSYRANFGRSLLGEVPGSVDLVRELHGAGVRQWGLTNWSAELYPQAPARFAFLDLLEDVVVSGEVGVAKPDPAVYEVTRSRTGLAFEALVFVDDRVDNVEAAIACGMDGLVFTDAASLRLALRDRGLPV